MTKQARKLPQISRIIPAWGIKITVLVVLAAFLALNLFTPLPSKLIRAQQAKLAVMLSPKDVSNHLLLTQEYLGQGNMKAVERELTLAENLSSRLASPPASLREALRAGSLQSPVSSVLGVSLSPLKILEKIKNEPQKIKKEVSFWEKIVAEKPDYRDAYLQLAILNYQIYETQKAKAYLEKAKALDPNFEATKKLEKLLNN